MTGHRPGPTRVSLPMSSPVKKVLVVLSGLLQTGPCVEHVTLDGRSELEFLCVELLQFRKTGVCGSSATAAWLPAQSSEEKPSPWGSRLAGGDGP